MAKATQKAYHPEPIDQAIAIAVQALQDKSRGARTFAVEMLHLLYEARSQMRQLDASTQQVITMMTQQMQTARAEAEQRIQAVRTEAEQRSAMAQHQLAAQIMQVTAQTAAMSSSAQRDHEALVSRVEAALSVLQADSKTASVDIARKLLTNIVEEEE